MQLPYMIGVISNDRYGLPMHLGLGSFQEASACDFGKMQIGTVYVLKKGKEK